MGVIPWRGRLIEAGSLGLGRTRAAIAPLLARPVVREVVAPLIVTRVAIVAIALISYRLPIKTENDLSVQHWLSALSRWDGAWYLRIAESGYDYTPGQFSSVAFAPLLPLLMRLGAPLFGGGKEALLLAGIVVVNVALCAALAYLVALARFDVDASTARRAALYLIVFPTAFFLSALYPESLFLAFAIASFYHARRGQWLLAGVFAVGCALARPHGVLIVVALAAELVLQHGLSLRAIARGGYALVLPVAAFAGWLGYLYANFGDPLVFLRTQSAWGRGLMAPWQTLANYFGPQRGPISDLLFTIAFVALAVVVAFRLRPSYAVYAATFLLVPISTGQLYSIMRFGLALFPAFIVLARLGQHRLLDRTYLAAALMIGGAFVSFFAAGLFFLA